MQPGIPTSEEITRHYAAALDSVALLNAGRPAGMSEADWKDTRRRNVEHLQLMVARPFWTTQDLAPLRDAIKRNPV